MNVLKMFFEKDLEDMMFENRLTLKDRGFAEFYPNVARQVRLPLGGIIDILTWDIVGDLLKVRVIELKKNSIDIAAFTQVSQYAGIFFAHSIMFEKLEIEIVLVGLYPDGDLLDIITAIDYPNIKLYTYSFDYNGLKFEKFTTKPKKSIEELKVKLGSSYESFVLFYQSLKSDINSSIED